MSEPVPALLDDDVLQAVLWLWEAPPPDGVMARARELLLDTVGCAIAGTAEPEVAALFRLGAGMEPGAVRFPGVPDGMSVGAFTRGFAAAACWHEACEGLAVAHGRPGLHAIPAVLGLGLARGLTLGALLEAVCVGFEVGGRMGVVCRIRPGMHVDGTWGSFGAAAAVSRLMGASVAEAMGGLSHVACHMPFSLYWPIKAGSTARNAYPGHGAAHGAAAAVAGMAGLGGPAGSISEMLRRALGIEVAAEMPGVGRWLLLEGYLKPYPAVRHVHYGAAAAEEWRGDAGAIDAIRLLTYPEAMTYCGNRAPETAIQAQFSLTYGVAHCLAYGGLNPAAYRAERLADPLVRRLEAMMVVEADPALAASGGRGGTLEVTMGAEVWRRRVDAVPGDAGMPMSRDQVRAKFMAYAAPVIGEAWAGAIARRVLQGALDAPFGLDA